MINFSYPEDGPSTKHQFLRRKKALNSKSGAPQKLEPLAQNNGLKGFNKGMNFKGKGAPRLSRKSSSNVPPGGHSSLNLFSADDAALPNASLARSSRNPILQPLCHSSPGRMRCEELDGDSNTYKNNKSSQRGNHRQNASEGRYDGGEAPRRNESRTYQQPSPREQQSQRQSNRQDKSGKSSSKAAPQRRHSPEEFDSYSNHRQSSQHWDEPKEGNSRGALLDDGPRFGTRTGQGSSNAYANGAQQNVGNVLTDRSSTRIHAPPGGVSTFSLAHDSVGPTAAQRKPLQPISANTNTAPTLHEEESHKLRVLLSRASLASEGVARDYAPREVASPEYASRKYALREYSPQGGASRKCAPRDGAARDYAPRDYSPRDRAPRDHASRDRAPHESSSRKQASHDGGRDVNLVIKPQAVRATSRGSNRYSDGGTENERAVAIPRHRRRTADVATSKAPDALPGLEHHYNEKQRKLLGMN